MYAIDVIIAIHATLRLKEKSVNKTWLHLSHTLPGRPNQR